MVHIHQCNFYLVLFRLKDRPAMMPKRMMPKRIASLAALACVGVSSSLIAAPEVAEAQDLLPRDNGIFEYHVPPRYRDSESHPLRLLAYVFHPVGWVLREGVTRPWSAFAGSTTVTKSVFGFREPFDYREPICFGGSDVPNCRDFPPYRQIYSGDAGADSDAAKMGMNGHQVYFPDVNFEFNKHTLNELGKGRVRQIARLLASVPNLKIVVEGHTDYKGSDEYNMELGKRRAQNVVQELTELGIDPARLGSISYGESQPVFTEEEDWARAANRRVEFTVQGEGTEKKAGS